MPKLKLIKKEPLEGDVISFVWEAPDDFKWEPGQFMKYTLPHENSDNRGIERWFTIAAAPYEKHPRITTHISEKRSSFKTALNNMAIGDTIQADNPDGEFTLRGDDTEYVFIAGGIGFTPFHAILNELDHDGKLPKITILYGARDDHPVFHEELDKLKAKYPQIDLHYIVDPDRINEDIIKKFVPDITKPLFYVSGPEPMVEAFEDMLQKMGVPKDNLHLDFFPGYDWQ